MVGFAVRLADVSDSVAIRKNIRSFIASRHRRLKVDDRAHEARVTAGERGRFRPVDQRGRIPSDRHYDQPAIDSKGDGKQSG
jgi:hypothetical protein